MTATLPARADVVVIGAGIIGLAVAHELGGRDPRREIIVIDKEDRLAAHQTGRNSGVLHSGLYYKPGSLKARTATAGRARMVEFCREHGIAHEVCGKVVVATAAEELPRLAALEERGRANGLALERIDAGRLREVEPHAAGIAALFVPETGIADFRAVCERLATVVVERGGQVWLRTQLIAMHERPGAVTVETSAGSIEADVVVNCAGLFSDRVARLHAADDGTRIVPFRGEYYELRADRTHLVRNLIYPVPDPAFPFLGVHFTRMIDGGVHAGPNAVLALAREGYRWRDVDARDIGEVATNPAFWKLAEKYWRTGVGEVVRSLSRSAFVRALQRLVPDVTAGDLVRAPAGVRAQALAGDGSLVDDFALRESARILDVVNAPSPAATASLEIARHIADRVASHWG